MLLCYGTKKESKTAADFRSQLQSTIGSFVQVLCPDPEQSHAGRTKSLFRRPEYLALIPGLNYQGALQRNAQVGRCWRIKFSVAIKHHQRTTLFQQLHSDRQRQHGRADSFSLAQPFNQRSDRQPSSWKELVKSIDPGGKNIFLQSIRAFHLLQTLAQFANNLGLNRPGHGF